LSYDSFILFLFFYTYDLCLIYKGPVRGCGFKRWWTVPLCDELDKIKVEKNEMKQDLEAAKKRVEAQVEKIFLMEKKFETLEKKYESLNKYQ